MRYLVISDIHANLEAFETVMAEAKRQDDIPYDVKDVELGHHGKECSFEPILRKYQLMSDPAPVLLAILREPRVCGAQVFVQHAVKGPGPRLSYAVAAQFRDERCSFIQRQAPEWPARKPYICVNQTAGFVLTRLVGRATRAKRIRTTSGNRCNHRGGLHKFSPVDFLRHNLCPPVSIRG